MVDAMNTQIVSEAITPNDDGTFRTVVVFWNGKRWTQDARTGTYYDFADANALIAKNASKRRRSDWWFWKDAKVK